MVKSTNSFNVPTNFIIVNNAKIQYLISASFLGNILPFSDIIGSLLSLLFISEWFILRLMDIATECLLSFFSLQVHATLSASFLNRREYRIIAHQSVKDKSPGIAPFVNELLDEFLLLIGIE